MTQARDLHKLQALATEQAIPLDFLPRNNISYQISADENGVQHVLQNIRSERFGSKRHIIRRNPSKTKPWDDEELDLALQLMVDNDGPAEQIKALVGQGARVYRPKPETRSLSQSIRGHKPTETQSTVLESAAKRRRADILSILAPIANLVSVNQAFAIALFNEDLLSVEILLQARANPNLYVPLFLECVTKRRTELIVSMCACPVPINKEVATQALSVAIWNEDVTSVYYLLKSGADSNCGNGASFLQAIQKPYLQMAMYMCLSDNPPTPHVLATAAEALSIGSRSDEQHLRCTRLLLATGLPAPSINNALIDAIETRHDDIVTLLVQSKGASVMHNECQAAKSCIEDSNIALLRTLFRASDASLASDKLLPFAQNLIANNEIVEYQPILQAILDLGPQQGVLNQCLLAAVMRLHVPEVKMYIDCQASADFQNGDALEFAVSKGDIQIVELLCRTANETCTRLRAMKPLLRLPRSSRYEITRFLLKNDLKGREVDELLLDLIKENLDTPDYALIELLIPYSNVDCYDSQCFRVASSNGNQKVLQLLLRGNPNSVSIGHGVKSAFSLKDASTVTAILRLLAPYNPTGKGLEEALLLAIDGSKNDSIHLVILLRQASANVDINLGEPVLKAFRHCQLQVILLLLEHVRKQETLDHLFANLDIIPNHKHQRKISEAILLQGVSKQRRNSALIRSMSQPTPDPMLIDILLAHGADVNVDTGQPMKSAIVQNDLELFLKLLRSRQLNEVSRDSVVQEILKVSDLERKLLWSQNFLTHSRGSNVLVLTKHLPQSFSGDDRDIPLLQLFLEHGAVVESSSISKAVKLTNLATLNELLQNISSTDVFLKALEGSYQLNFPEQYSSLSLIFQSIEEAQIPTRERQSVENHVNERLVELTNSQYSFSEISEVLCLLLRNGADVHFRANACLYNAVFNCDHELLGELIKHSSKDVVSELFELAVKTDLTWTHERGPAVLSTLIGYGANGTMLDSALLHGVQNYTQLPQSKAIVGLLIQSGARPDELEYQALQTAAKLGDASLYAEILEAHCSIPALEYSIQQLLLQKHDENQLLDILKRIWSKGKSAINLNQQEEGCPPCLFQTFIRGYDSQIFEQLLTMGASPDQRYSAKLLDDTGPEKVPLLSYLISNPLNLSSPTQILQMAESLLRRPVDVNMQTSKSKLTPLILVMQKHDFTALIPALIKQGADVNVPFEGKSPLFLQVTMGRKSEAQLLIDAGAESNDGSLHEAVRNCNWSISEMLLKAGHNPNDTSTLHMEQSPLQVLLTDVKPASKGNQDLAKTVRVLYDAKADVHAKRAKKSLLFQAIDGQDPVSMTRALLEVCKEELAKVEYQTANDEIFSALGYVQRYKSRWDATTWQSLVRILENNGVNDVRYNLTGPQPEDFSGAPSDISKRETEYRAREALRREEEQQRERIREEKRKDHELEIQRMKSAAALEQQLSQQTHNLAQAQEMERAQVRNQATRADAELKIEMRNREAVAAGKIAEHERQSELHHAQNLSRIRLEEQRESNKQRRAILSEEDSYHERQHERAISEAQGKQKLIESQRALMKELPRVPLPLSRQIGYVEGEVDEKDGKYILA